MQETGQVVAKAVTRALEGEMVPWNRLGHKLSGFQALIVGSKHATDCGCGVNHNDRGVTDVGVDVDQPVEAHLKSTFFSGFPDGGGHQRLAAIDVASGEHPFAIARLNGSSHQNDATRRDANDGAHGNLRIEIEDEATSGADESVRFAGFEEPALERGAASRTEAERWRIVERVQIQFRHWHPRGMGCLDLMRGEVRSWRRAPCAGAALPRAQV